MLGCLSGEKVTDLYVCDFARVAQVIDTGSHVLSPRNISLKTCVFLQLAGSS